MRHDLSMWPRGRAYAGEVGIGGDFAFGFAMGHLKPPQPLLSRTHMSTIISITRSYPPRIASRLRWTLDLRSGR